MIRKLLLVSPFLVLGGCGAEYPSERNAHSRDSGKLSVKTEGDQLELRSADGKIVYRQAERAAAFPDYAPQYPGSSVSLSAEYEGARGEKGYTLIQQTSEKPGKVLAFYKRSIVQNGLKLQIEQESGDTATLIAAKNLTDANSVMISTTGHATGQTIISITGER